MNWDYRAPRWSGHGGWLGGHLQTVVPSVAGRRGPGPDPQWHRERWTTPDGDFIDVDTLEPQPPAPGTAAAAARPLLVLFHGLEGSSGSHYARSLAQRAQALGWRMAVPHFRGCSGELNLAPRAYHLGDYAEVDWILRRLHAASAGPLVAVGVSLGGNALLRWAQESGEAARAVVRAVAAVSVPLDPAAGGHAIGTGVNRLLYTRYFLRTMKPKALAKLRQFPGLFDESRLRAARDLREFDDVFTAPLHGFRNTEDYWHRTATKPHLARIRVPTLVVNALNDPFVPAASLPPVHAGGPGVLMWRPASGGHAGFPGGRFPGHGQDMPRAVTGWLHRHLPTTHDRETPHG